jgi:hypothetical protein
MIVEIIVTWPKYLTSQTMAKEERLYAQPWKAASDHLSTAGL